MDWSQLNINEFLYQGRFHIGGAMILSVFIVALAREAIWELRTRRARRREEAGETAPGAAAVDA